MTKMMVGFVKESIRYIIQFLQQEVEGTQWGRPGPGGTYWRPSAITGQGFYDKMVNCCDFIMVWLRN